MMVEKPDDKVTGGRDVDLASRPGRPNRPKWQGVIRHGQAAIISERGMMSWAALEAAIPLLPVELVLIPLTRLRPRLAFRFAMLAALFSALGAIYSYALGHFADGLLSFNGVHATSPWLERLIVAVDKWGEGLVLLLAFAPAPFFVIALTAGLLHLGLVPFLGTVLVSRAARFYLVTTLTLYLHKREKPG